MSKKIGMIPAAGRGSRMLSLTDNHPKPMLPFNNKPIIGHLLEWFIKEEFDEVIIIVEYKHDKIIDYVTKVFLKEDNIKIRFVRQGGLSGLGHAIYKGLNAILDDDASLLIVLGDIILDDSLTFNYNEDFIVYNEVDDYERWCMIQLDDKNEIINFYDKPKEQPPTNKNVIGIYNFSVVRQLKNIYSLYDVEHFVDSNEELEFSFFLSEYIDSNIVKGIYNNDYLDFGVLSDLNKSKLQVVREFNKIELIDDDINELKIKKSSVKKPKKILNEFLWYQKIPLHMRKYTPTTYEFNSKIGSTEGTNYVMSYIDSTPLQELFMYNLPDFQSWVSIFDNIYNYFLDSRNIENKEQFYEENKNKLVQANIKMLREKTKERVDQIRDMFPHREYVINGQFYDNPIYHLEKILKRAEEISLDVNIDNLVVLHGDLFFGNMMYDIEKESLKVIDPRGEYGEFTIYGDMRYDLAKLYHSVIGNYDFIVNGLYELRDYDSTLNYSIFNGDSNKKIGGFIHYFIEVLGNDVDDIEFITGLLFLTMIPLHSENKNNQKMQFIKACEILKNTINGDD